MIAHRMRARRVEHEVSGDRGHHYAGVGGRREFGLPSAPAVGAGNELACAPPDLEIDDDRVREARPERNPVRAAVRALPDTRVRPDVPVARVRPGRR